MSALADALGLGGVVALVCVGAIGIEGVWIWLLRDDVADLRKREAVANLRANQLRAELENVGEVHAEQVKNLRALLRGANDRIKELASNMPARDVVHSLYPKKPAPNDSEGS